MDTSEIRFRNFILLYERFIHEEGLEIEYGALARFAHFVGMSPKYCSHIKTRVKNVGHALARKLELAFKLPHGWMDAEHMSGAIPMGNGSKEFVALVTKLYEQYPNEMREMVTSFLGKLALRDSKLVDATKGTSKTKRGTA